ncbi:response regulator [Paucibacter sp. APW11]|uniref:Response regulator n=1 Tax=Roseateles aquae TaxID=3077235 RepID=A0ABU3P9T3_9BURK|nr:response regulator [Paucibacter sp. APW11]MDT8999283.1 response regulator [Paucibacter sp. APW11]
MPDNSPAHLRVLIVDDSRAIQAIIHRVLEMAQLGPMLIETAGNGEQALRLVSSFKPDLIISDWHMPVVSGIEMLQALRQLGLNDVKVGFVTTETAERHLNEARSNGAVFVINKPFNDEDLLREVQRALTDRITAIQMAALEPPAALESRDALAALIKTTLGQIPFRLIAANEQTMADLKLPHSIAIYGADGQKTPHALGILDVNACCILGGGNAQLQPPPVRMAMQMGKPTPEMIQNSDRFMRAAAALLLRTAGAPEIKLKLSNLVGHPFDKLEALMHKNSGRSDYRLSVPGYGEGRMAFFRI